MITRLWRALAVSLIAAATGAVPSSSAYGLPDLNIEAATNRTLLIHWAYTNAGFILQEAAALTNWQSSTYRPLFESNTASFAIVAPATNASGFFRLKQLICAVFMFQ